MEFYRCTISTRTFAVSLPTFGIGVKTLFRFTDISYSFRILHDAVIGQLELQVYQLRTAYLQVRLQAVTWK